MSADHAASNTQVIIVGGGPVGLGLAIELGQRGIECVLVERYLQPAPLPKGQNLTQRTLEHFHFWGAEKELRAARTIPPEWGMGGITAYGTLLGRYAYDWMPRELVQPFYFTGNERLPQYAYEAVLRARLAELPNVRTLYGWTAETFGQDGQGAWTEIAERDGSGRRTLRAEYLVGCDGAHSPVREAAGITHTRSDHDRLMVLLVFRSRGLNERLVPRFPGKSFFSTLNPALDGYWQFFGRVDLEGTFFFHAPVPAGTTRDNYDFPALLRAAAGADFDVEILHTGFWDLRFAVADSYRAGRMFIAGDAAHSHPPYGGYGVNTGLEDAVNLGWKLAATLRGWGGERLLDSYDEERRPVFASTAANFIARAIEEDRKFLRAFDPDRDREAFDAEWTRRSNGAVSEIDAFEPNYLGSSVVWSAGGEPSAVGKHQFDALAGRHLAPRPLSDGRNVYEALGPGFTLLALDADPAAVEAFREAARTHGAPLTVLADSRAGGRELYNAALVLVRPDQFVAWSSDAAPKDAWSVLERTVGQ